MANLLQHISNYFIGTGIHKDYQQDRAYYRELIEDQKELKKVIRHSIINEGIDLFLMKAVPDLIDIGAIAYAISSKTPPYGLIPGEILRGVGIVNYHRNKKNKETLLEAIDIAEATIKNISDISDKL